jgi:CMP-N,N'-diacetyllegionaminic acid synthase
MLENKKILAITLARGGSKRIPRKNIIKIHNKPLIQYTIDEVKLCPYIDRYIVSTEDIEISNICNNLGVEVRIRPEELAQDTTTSAAAIKDVIDNIGEEYDIIVEIMNTNPLKSYIDINGCLEKLVSTQSDSVISVVRLWDQHPSRIKYIQNDMLKDFYPEIPESRRQDLTPEAYIRNGSIYAFWKSSFLKYENRLGAICRPYIMPSERTINIDEPEDLELARVLIKKPMNDIDWCSMMDGGCNNE